MPTPAETGRRTSHDTHLEAPHGGDCSLGGRGRHDRPGGRARGAEVYDHFSFHFSAEESFDDCGFTIDDDLTFDGQNVIGTVKGTQTLFFASLALRTEVVLTNPRTARGSA